MPKVKNLMAERRAILRRTTREVDVEVEVLLDGKGKFEGDTGIGFLNHMLEIFAKFSRFDVKVRAKGDVEVDWHHTVEDTALALGECIRTALSENLSIVRFWDATVPLDEALCQFVLDISGRPYFFYHNFDLIKDNFLREFSIVFFDGLARGGLFTCHARVISGEISHHVVEATFKASAICFFNATRTLEGGGISSTKGKIF